MRFGLLARAKLDKVNINNDLISIILPVFNAQNTLQRAINSIIKQTYPVWELIIVNDGSTDDSISIIKNINDKRVKKIFLKENKGLVYCLNLGISLSKGIYVARMDADDISLPERLFCQLQFLKHNIIYDLVGSQQYEFEDVTKSIINIWPKNEKKYLSNIYYFSYDIPHPTWMARSVWMKKYLYQEGNVYSEDQELLIRASLKSNYFLMNEPLLLYSKKEKVLIVKLRAIKNIFFKRFYNYFKNIYIFKIKIFINIPMDCLFFMFRFFYYLIIFYLSGLKSKTLKEKPIEIPTRVKKILNEF